MAIDTPQIVQTSDQLTAGIRLTIPRSEIHSVMDPAIQELMRVVAEQGIGPGGPWLSHHLRHQPDIFDFEVAVPVLAPVQPTGRVQPGRLPAARAVRGTHAGSYETLGTSWAELMTWIDGRAYVPGARFWEVYRIGPETSQNPDDWRTDLYRPLVG